MASVRDLHDRAMILAQEAMASRFRGDLEQSEQLAREAYQLEVQAADLVPESRASEPTRSILYRSAASLAYQCKAYDEAMRLVARGLSGYPAEREKRELVNLLGLIKFERFLHERSIVLEDNDLEMSLDGEAIGPGLILLKDFQTRLEHLSLLVVKTVQRMMHRTYQKSGPPSRQTQPFTQALATPKPASFAVTFKLLPTEGEMMPLGLDASDVIDEILTGIELINNAKEKSLKARMPEEAYYRQFVTMTRGMAPDGEKVNIVGFTSKRRSVALTRQQVEISSPAEPDIHEGDGEAARVPIEVEGYLNHATHWGRDEVGLTTAQNKQYVLVFQEGMDDAVRTYWNDWVSVKGMISDKRIFVTDILPSDEPENSSP